MIAPNVTKYGFTGVNNPAIVVRPAQTTITAIDTIAIPSDEA
jgi:hypothetical protein